MHLVEREIDYLLIASRIEWFGRPQERLHLSDLHTLGSFYLAYSKCLYDAVSGEPPHQHQQEEQDPVAPGTRERLPPKEVTPPCCQALRRAGFRFDK